MMRYIFAFVHTLGTMPPATGVSQKYIAPLRSAPSLTPVSDRLLVASTDQNRQISFMIPTQMCLCFQHW